eukprot:gene10515-21929_t
MSKLKYSVELRMALLHPNNPCEMHCELIKYGFVISYANMYDEEWIQFCSYLKKICDVATSKISQPLASINSLPMENILVMMSYMDANSLCRVASVRKSWTEPASIHLFWEGLCAHKFNLCPSAFRFSKHNHPKALYRASTVSFRDLMKGSPGFKARPTISSAFIQPIPV